MEVPWRSEFEQKFTIELKKESPIVLVMSQLDTRYFEGLQGQYTFRLQFRLHEIDSPDEENYIIRSHGNYLMNRSVVAELKSLPAGTYTVFMMVVAQRDQNRPTVEDVMREELRHREDNEKLAQVGTAYDLAHTKGLSHMQAKTTFRINRDKAKARDSRVALRKVFWQKRQNTREIVRKQNKKNSDKREGTKAKIAEEAEKKKERKPKDRGIQTEDIAGERKDKSSQTEDPLQESANIVIDTLILNERDKAVQTEDFPPSSNESQATPVTPKSDSSVPRSSQKMTHGRPLGPLPPPPQSNYQNHRRSSSNASNFSRGPAPPPPSRPGPYVTSEGESSASPVSDYDMWSDDDPTLKPRNPPNESKPPKEKDDEEKNAPEPWNAVCIVGFRVYSKDEGLVLKICEEDMDEEAAALKEKDEAGTDGDVEDGSDNIDNEEKEKSDKDGPLKDATTPNEPIPTVGTNSDPLENSKTAVVSTDSSKVATEISLLVDSNPKTEPQDEEPQMIAGDSATSTIIKAEVDSTLTISEVVAEKR